MAYKGEKKRDYESRKSKEKREAVNEIAPLPACENIALRNELEADPPRWLREILPDVFYADFTKSQLHFIAVAWEAIIKGAWKNFEAYRGIGKTSILSGLLFKALCEGVVRHALYITAEGGASVAQAARWFYDALYDDYNATGEEARLFTRLYPEISVPLQKRAGRAQRPLTYEGAPLRIEMKTDRIVLPMVPGSRCKGSLLRFTSISSGGIRGANHTIPGDGAFRVRCVMLDDIQNDQTARSVIEVDSIMATIQKSIRGLAGRRADGSRESLTVLSAITQNQPQDVAARMISDAPEFATELLPFVTRLPDNFEEWKKYQSYRAQTLRRMPLEQARQALKAYYIENKARIANGVEVDDPRLFENWQADAIHYAVDYWSASEASFWCEFQNDAERAAVEMGGSLTVVDVTRKIKRNADGAPLRRYWLPESTAVLTAHIDAGEHYLNYQITAFSVDFKTAHVVDFGIFPEQYGGVASKKKFNNDIQEIYKSGDKFDKLRAATFDCLKLIFEQQYFNAKGAPIDINAPTKFEQHARPRGRQSKKFCLLSVCGVDCSDGEMEVALWSAISDFHKYEGGKFDGRAVPCYGVEASSRLLRYYDLKPGEWRRQKRTGAGFDWIENAQARKSIGRSFPNVYATFTYDANTAKTRRDAAWRLPKDREGAASIFEEQESQEALLMFAMHQTAEEYIVTRKNGYNYNRWRMKKPRVSDNEFLDTDAACRALAEYAGCAEPVIGETEAAAAVAKTKRVRRAFRQ